MCSERAAVAESSVQDSYMESDDWSESDTRPLIFAAVKSIFERSRSSQSTTCSRSDKQRCIRVPSNCILGDDVMGLRSRDGSRPGSAVGRLRDLFAVDDVTMVTSPNDGRRSREGSLCRKTLTFSFNQCKQIKMFCC